MKLEFHIGAADFSEKTKDLSSEPATSSFILSLLDRCMKTNWQPTIMASIWDQGALLGAGLQTEFDRELILSKFSKIRSGFVSENVEGFFAKELSKKIRMLPGVNGPKVSSENFSKEWIAIVGGSSRLSTQLRLFELSEIKNFPKVNGVFRLATSTDEEILVRWLKDYAAEAMPHLPKKEDDRLLKETRESIQKGQLYIWEIRGQPVSFAGSRRETPTEKWVGPVYTPKHLRGCGYASALVANISQMILKTGKKAILFTDLANPTSNSIYQRIGYAPLVDYDHYLFSPYKIP